MTLIVFEVILNGLMLVLSLFLLIMFLERRRGVPRLFIGFYLFTVIYTGVDLLVIELLAVPGVEVEMKDVQDLIRVVVSAVIWGAYFLRSRRVKATFTRSRRGREPVAKGDLTPQAATQ